MSAFSDLAEQAAEQGLHFLLIGGHAVSHHRYPRTTEDTDILICKDDKDRWLQLTETIGLKLFHDGGNFLQFTPPETGGLRLDMMLVNASTFTKMTGECEASTLEGRDVNLPSLDHLIALKLHALKHARGIRVLKDMDDMANLITNNRINVRSAEFRELVLKHGTSELYEKFSKLSDE